MTVKYCRTFTIHRAIVIKRNKRKNIVHITEGGLNEDIEILRIQNKM